MNAVVGESDQEVRRAAMRAIAEMRFCIDVLSERSCSDLSGFFWRIKLKVARHMDRVLVRHIGEFDLETLPNLGPDEQQQLLQAHPLLQLDPPRPVTFESNSGWMRDVEAKVVRFANRMRSRRSTD